MANLIHISQVQCEMSVSIISHFAVRVTAHNDMFDAIDGAAKLECSRLCGDLLMTTQVGVWDQVTSITNCVNRTQFR